MENQDPKQPESVQSSQSEPRIKPGKPNDFGSVQIDAHLKIYDPNSDQVYVQGRA